MSALDRYIEDAAVRLDLGYRARSVVAVLVRWIASHPLGLDGLAQQFEQAGLERRFHAWRAGVAPLPPVLASELEQAIGTHALTTLARRAGLPSGAFRVVACELLPGLIALVAPFPGAGGATAGVDRPYLPRLGGAGTVPSRAMQGRAARAMLWLLAGLALVGFSSWLHLKIHAPHWVPPAVGEPRDARFSLQQYGHRVFVHGCLPTEAARRQAWNAVIDHYGAANVRGGIALDRAARPPRWLDRLSTRLPQLAGDGLALDFNGHTLTVDTLAMDPARRLQVSQMLRRDFGDLHSTGLWGPGLAALAALPAQADADQVVDALNKTRLTFGPKSAALTGGNTDTVQAVAAVLAAAPADLRVQVAAHTDSAGSADANLQLSQQRADQVVQALQAHGVPATRLLATGYGQQHPLADNRSDAGRARNRRIEYTVIAANEAGAGADAVVWQPR